VPPWILVGGRCLTALATVVAVTLVLLSVGALGYNTEPRATAVPGLVATIVVGTAAFACIGFGVTSFLRDPESAQTTVQAFALPLYFISTIFLPPHLVPPTLRHIAAVFPVEHLSHALFTAYNPHLTGPGFDISDLAIITVWGVAGLLLALRRFDWMPIAPRPRQAGGRTPG
jgi:ABC-2 type transport system permease protein